MAIPALEIILVSCGVVGGIWLSQRRRVVIYPYQKGLHYQKGHLKQILGPGIYHHPRYNADIKVIDTRPQTIKISAQEMLTADKITLKISQNMVIAINDPVKATHNSTDYSQQIHQQAQIILRNLIGTTSLDDILETRDTINTALQAGLAPHAEQLGLEIKTAEIKDIILPAGLKKAFSGVAEARKDAQRQLEKARGEQALLRQLANTAKLYREHPMLLNARLVQSLGDGQNNIVFQTQQTEK